MSPSVSPHGHGASLEHTGLCLPEGTTDAEVGLLEAKDAHEYPTNVNNNTQGIKSSDHSTPVLTPFPSSSSPLNAGKLSTCQKC